MRAWIHNSWAAACCVVLFATAAWSAEAEPTFNIWEIRVQGNSLLDRKSIEETIYPHLGPDKTFADIQAARAALEQRYRDAGFPTVYVDVPEQNIRNGLVKVRVTVGRISRVRITGARYYSNGWIRENLPEASPGDAPRLARFNAQLAQLNSRSADRKVTPVLKPGKEPGTVELELKVKDELPLHAALEVNNRNTVATTDTRLVGELSYANLWQRDHTIGLLYQVSPEDTDESEVWALNYSFRPARSANSYAFYAVRSNSDIETTGSIGVLGRGRVYGARAILAMPGTDRLINSVVLGADYKDFEETIGFDDEIQTPIKYINWSAAWTGAYVAESNLQNFSIAANFGLRGLVNDELEFTGIPLPGGGCLGGKRCGSRANYLYFRGTYDIWQSLPAGMSLFIKASGQWSPEPLISNEQFNAGGLDTVRGYYEAEALGDSGVAATVELRSPDFGSKLLAGLEETYVYAFTDAARLRINPVEGVVEENSTQELASAGVGLRFKGYGFSGIFNWAHPFRSGPATVKDDDQLLFRLRYGF